MPVASAVKRMNGQILCNFQELFLPCNICNGSSFSISISSVTELVFKVRQRPITVPIGGASENMIIERKYCAFVA